MKRLLIILFGLWAIGYGLWGQETIVVGEVYDATTGEPIVGCEVYLSPYTPAERVAPRDFVPVGPSMVLTDGAGYYEFAHVHLGKYNVSVTLFVIYLGSYFTTVFVLKITSVSVTHFSTISGFL